MNIYTGIRHSNIACKAFVRESLKTGLFSLSRVVVTIEGCFKYQNVVGNPFLVAAINPAFLPLV